MVRQRRERVARRGRTVGERRGPERRLPDRGEVDRRREVVCDAAFIQGRQLHEEIVRVLPIHQRSAPVLLAGLQQERVAAGADRERLGAEHEAQVESAT